MLEKTRSLMDDQRAQQVAQGCIADARGRTGFEDRDYTQAALFIKFQQAAKSVNGGEIARHYSDGVEIQKAIHDARLVEIRRVQKNSALDS
jgi:tRNA nucleotidyltransferase (CCA-adding enzyme)